MIENDIVICGHGSGTPSFKKLGDYCTTRQSSTASNGLKKGLVEVVRFLNTDEQRSKFKELYSGIIGRNVYNQSLREYAYTAYKNGKYYSDCSSSIALAFVACGIKGVGEYNTASLHYNGEKVSVSIENGHIAKADLSKLKVGDCLLFRGNDASRPLQIGHVEAVYAVPDETDGAYVNVISKSSAVEVDNFLSNGKESQVLSCSLKTTVDLGVRPIPDYSLRKQWYHLKAGGYISAYRVVGWVETAQGRWYEKNNHGYPAGVVETIDGKDYAFDREGYLITPNRLEADGVLKS